MTEKLAKKLADQRVNNSELKRVEEMAQSFFSEIHDVREKALRLSREIVRNSANTIRLTHRGQFKEARKMLSTISVLVKQTNQIRDAYPQVFYAGYIEDALKEFVEASTTLAIIDGNRLPGPSDLSVTPVPYLNGLADTVGELRRYILDALRGNNIDKTENLLDLMDDIYMLLISIDFPDAVTRGLRRSADQTRGLLERTRGDLTVALRQRHLETRMVKLEKSINRSNTEHS